jgi:hypothetical protein
MCINGMNLLKYAEKDGGIQLTKSGFLVRKCVVWAAEDFRWPGYESQELYRLNRVLDEQDFVPLSVMHGLMFSGRLIRHVKGRAELTKSGISILGDHGALQVALFETYFTAFDFDAYERFPSLIEYCDYRHFLAVVDNRLGNWVSLEGFTEWCLPVPIIVGGRLGPLFEACLFLSIRLIRPLLWLGLLEEEPAETRQPVEQLRIRKTPLFNRFLVFDERMTESSPRV